MTENWSVTVDHLSRHFGSFKAVDEVSFKVRKGEIFGFLGPNGSGKSTTIRMLCGLLLPTSGTGTVAGLDITTQAEAVKGRIGYMSQRFSLYTDLTVVQNLEFWSTLYRVPPEDRKTRIPDFIRLVQLTGFEDRLAGDLPGGIRQRLALACSMVHNPAVLFLDEPTGGVDPVSRRNFWSIIDQVSARGTTVFVTTHFLDEAEYCHTIGLIHNSRLIALGSPAELKSDSMKSVSVEILCSDPVSGLDSLGRNPLVSDVSLFGLSLHAMLQEGTVLTDDIRMALTESLEQDGQNVRSVSQIVPSLEDVFIHLIEQNRKETVP